MNLKNLFCEVVSIKSLKDQVLCVIGPQDSVDVTGETPTELLDSAFDAFRNNEKYFAEYISPSTPSVRKRVA